MEKGTMYPRTSATKLIAIDHLLAAAWAVPVFLVFWFLYWLIGDFENLTVTIVSVACGVLGIQLHQYATRSVSDYLKRESDARELCRDIILVLKNDGSRAAEFRSMDASLSQHVLYVKAEILVIKAYPLLLLVLLVGCITCKEIAVDVGSYSFHWVLAVFALLSLHLLAFLNNAVWSSEKMGDGLRDLDDLNSYLQNYWDKLKSADDE